MPVLHLNDIPPTSKQAFHSQYYSSMNALILDWAKSDLSLIANQRILEDPYHCWEVTHSAVIEWVETNHHPLTHEGGPLRRQDFPKWLMGIRLLERVFNNQWDQLMKYLQQNPSLVGCTVRMVYGKVSHGANDSTTYDVIEVYPPGLKPPKPWWKLWQ